MQYLEALNRKGCRELLMALNLSAVNHFEQAYDILKDKHDSESLFLKALCLLNLEHTQEALILFQRVASDVHGNFLASAFCDRITGTESEACKMYGGTEFSSYFKMASQSFVFDNVYRAIDNTVRSLFSNLDELTFLDIGIGTAKQSLRLINMFEKCSNARRLTIIGVEPYESMRAVAQKNLEEQSIKKRHFKIEHRIVDKFAQDLEVEDITDLLDGKNIDVVVASASIHHMVVEDKKKLLGSIRKLNPKLLVISDADSNHESYLRSLSVELVANVTSFYENLLACMNLKAPDKEVKEYYKGFCYFDARNIIAGSDWQRIEYHTTAQNWKSYLEEAGFKILPPQVEWVKGIDPDFSRIENDYIVTTYYNRPLLFQITAT